MRAKLMAVAFVVAVTAVGCGDDGEGVVVEGTGPATPYSGPLKVPVKDLDEDSPRATRIESGAAGRALECDGEIYSGGGSGTWSKGDGGSTPAEGLEAYFDIEQPDVPRTGYREERREGDRVLYSFDVDGRTKVAVIVAKDGKDRPGWGPETSASCDPAELPESFTDTQWYEIWTDRDGRRVPITKLNSSVGPEHCDWQKAHFLSTGQGKDARLYARDPAEVLPQGALSSPYDGDVRLPKDARDTGYHYKDQELWLTDDDPTKAYIRTPDGVEAWPEVNDGFGCA
ncbi:hypothetical protein BN159_1089 [Streptomyces davaonensis JCM 4913]|uniref:Lipoprotein n=1 Tax=Streptomyces davaonensis (strain DSM 101723 / JCM 4913 / KCC S-0913 / 768) TaxID=1214101 RepID=K4QWQ2_STRDJ|nr:hypothetical protein [Streptomyces davaonensis]CCK25468.1 hypothetical protein BN159_1089 [Streptomyces davaonensis JCM 4913]